LFILILLHVDAQHAVVDGILLLSMKFVDVVWELLIIMVFIKVMYA